MLKTLWESTAQFHRIFRGDTHPITSNGAMKKLKEEVQELEDAIEDFHAGRDTRRAVIDESLDVLVTLVGVWISMRINWAMVSRGAYRVIAKNAKKTKATHEYRPDTDTIERIGRQ